LLLTKRPQNIARQLPESWGAGWHNVAIGITAENQEELDRRASVVLRIPARLHFVSCEPLLGPLDFNALSDGVENLNALTGLRENGFGDIVTRHRGSRIGWVIAGAESGNGARPMDDSWVRNIRDQCRDARVPFFYKQKIVSGRKVSLPLIDDRQHAEKPIWMS
jgi:protein gp37